MPIKQALWYAQQSYGCHVATIIYILYAPSKRRCHHPLSSLNTCQFVRTSTRGNWHKRAGSSTIGGLTGLDHWWHWHWTRWSRTGDLVAGVTRSTIREWWHPFGRQIWPFTFFIWCRSCLEKLSEMLRAEKLSSTDWGKVWILFCFISAKAAL